MAIWKAKFSFGEAVFGDGCRPYFTHTPDPKKQSWKPTQTGIIYKHAVRQIPTLFSGGAGVGVRKLWPTPVNEGRTKLALLLSFEHLIGSKNTIFATFCPYFTALLRFHFCASCSFFLLVLLPYSTLSVCYLLSYFSYIFSLPATSCIGDTARPEGTHSTFRLDNLAKETIFFCCPHQMGSEVQHNQIRTFFWNSYFFRRKKSPTQQNKNRS